MNSKAKLLVEQFQKNILNQLKQGIREAAESGILAGYPVIDFKAYISRWILP